MKITPASVRALFEGNAENFIAASTPGGIEAQEAAGQQEFVANSLLPIKLSNCTEKQLNAIGILLGDLVDETFRKAQLPDGWSKVPTEHSMWSKLVDDKGRIRAMIFFKAAFYDYNAHLILERRFSMSVRPPGGYESGNETQYECIVTDCGNVIWKTDPVEKGDRSWEVRQQLEELGKAYLDQHFPEWQDPTAYWD